MSYIEAPTLTNLRKRKRSARSASVVSNTASQLPNDAINPHSYGPSTHRQILVAGLPHSERLPSEIYHEFPHRPLPESAMGDGLGSGGLFGHDSDKDIDTDDDDDDYDDNGSENPESSMGGTSEEDKSGAADSSEQAARFATKQRQLLRREVRRRRNADRLQRAYDQKVGTLAAIVQRGLQEAEHGTLPSVLTATGQAGQLAGPIGLARAKRAFGLILRTEVKGRPVDLRRNFLWAMGAEILMREGEDEGTESSHSGSNTQKTHPRRWGSAANIPRVRAFYEDLIQQHPYNRLWPRSMSALTFWPAMAGTELYNIHAEVKRAMERLDDKARERGEKEQSSNELDNGAEDEEGESDKDSAGEGHYGGHDHDDDYNFDQDVRRRRNHPDRLAREEARGEALNQARNLGRRMDAIMATAPYATSPEMLRLRGMLALFMGDLAIVTPPRTPHETQGGRQLRAQERSRARARFARLLEVDKDIQTGRYHRKGGVPDTVVNEYIERMSRGANNDDESSSSSGGEEEDMSDGPTDRSVFTSLSLQ
ncbi:hypothetical protein SEPCBS57363_005792 [Sporothrix epigloea]|uniref:Uncharacterized protein n=1 Tax=Sporothrix epigloea TaxID=1892477 RepID=A0ABP0E2L0_9PEZI